jgi:hypothetical protein
MNDSLLSRTVTLKMYDLILIQILLHIVYSIMDRLGWVTRLSECVTSLL